MAGLLNAFTTGKPFRGTNSLEDSIERDFGAQKGLVTQNHRSAILVEQSENVLGIYLGHGI